MSVRIARTQAEAIAARCNIDCVPVNIKKIAKYLGLQVVESDLGDDVSGLLVTNSESSTIAVQKSHSLNRKRFTIAHEIGHFVLGHQFGHVHVDHGYIVTPRNSRSAKGIDPKEIEANQFAASLLMPENLLRSKIESSTMVPLRDFHITQLAQLFEVSEHAMTIRLSALKLI